VRSRPLTAAGAGDDVVAPLLVYNKRHLQRCDRLLQRSFFVDYLLQRMQVVR
jgi:hypothetical protein